MILERWRQLLAAGGERPRLLTLPSSLGLATALILYFLLSFCCVRAVGVVGEVTAAWLDIPPRVAVSLEAPTPTWSGPPEEPNAGYRIGPIELRQTRPCSSIRIGSFRLPLAVNAYTGGPPDWPARVLWALTGDAGAVRLLHVLMGAILLLGVWALTVAMRPLNHGKSESSLEFPLRASLGALLLATDWSFVYYRKVLAGTELGLLAGGLILLWGLWRLRVERWPHAPWLIGLGAGLGLLSKSTFICTLLAFMLASLLLRAERPDPARRSHRALRWLGVLGLVLLLSSPLLLTGILQSQLPDAPRILSHDSTALQLSRLRSGIFALFGAGSAPTRESASTLLCFLFEPLRWFDAAYGLTRLPETWSPLRILGLSFALLGWLLAWVRPRPQDSPARFLSAAALLQIVLLYLANRDLHHLAQAAPTLALASAAGIAVLADRAPRLSPPRRSSLALLLALPTLSAGVFSLLRTDPLLSSLRVPSFLESGQAALIGLLHEHGVDRVWTSDYDLYGMIDARDPAISCFHAWGAVSRSEDRSITLAELLKASKGSYYLSVRPSAPMIYNLRPNPGDLLRASRALGLQARELGHIQDASGTWATLYRIEPGDL